MTIINANSIVLSFGGAPIIKEASFEMRDRERVGLVGANGAGKTTLFRVITGELSPDSGSVVKASRIKIGYMEQQLCNTGSGDSMPERRSLSIQRGDAGVSNEKNTVIGELMTVFSGLEDKERELEELSHRISENSGNLDALIKRQMELREEFESAGGLTYKSRGRAALLGLGFSPEELSMELSTQSGGQLSKLALAKLLLSGAELLLLDEPTNHLDLDAVRWLEDFLCESKSSFIVVSHDRYFLDRVTTRTLELENGKITSYGGNYSMYAAEKKKLRQELQHRYESQIAEIKRIEGIIEQQKSFNRERNIRTAESKQKMIDRLKKDIVEPDRETDTMSLRFETDVRSGDDVLIGEHLSKSYGDNTLFSDIPLHIRRGERVFLLGKNGCGKTTLFKALNREIKLDNGDFRFGVNVKRGYFDQIGAHLHPDKTALDEIWDDYRALPQTQIRKSLAAFLFKGEDVFKKVNMLSGGEKAKLSILKLILSRANFLLLDEPTNHLDIESREILEEALLSFDGTIFAISHDRYLINKLCTRILVLEKSGIYEVNGGYDAYLTHLLNNAERVKSNKIQERQPEQSDYKRKKLAQSQLRRAEGALKRSEESITTAEADIAELEEALQSPENLSDYEKLTALTEALALAKEKHELLLSEWEKLAQELECAQQEFELLHKAGVPN